MNPKIILNHKYVPKHEILKQKEVDELLKKYGITKDQLPKIKSTDPVVKAIKAQKGDVIKIYRWSPTAGTSVYYRVVV